jgi:presenilin-like A22 family membrane protease
MDAKIRAIDVFPMVIMGCLFVVVDLLAFWISGPFEAAGQVAFENPNDWSNILIFVSVMIVFTAIILVISRYRKPRIIQAIFLASTGILGLYVFYPLFGFVFSWQVSLALSVLVMAALVGLLLKYPEWYIVDLSGIITAVGAVGMIGISLGILIIIVLLVILAVYDAISVYKTKHMIDLADTLIDLKLPILFVFPKTRGYSLLKQTKGLKDSIDEGEKRDAFFMGVGDIVIPGILAAAAFHSIPVYGLTIGLSVVAGTLVGFAALMVLVMTGKPQAGLPFLCPGAILGYVISSLILTGGLAGLSVAL